MSGPAKKRRPSTHHLEAAEAKLPRKVHPKVPPTGAAKMRSTQAVPGSTGGAPARSTARPHPHLRQGCGIQAETCTQGQHSCLLCHTPSEGRLTNKSRPARSKQVQPAQPARHKTSPHMKSRQDCNRRLCRISLATKADLPTLNLDTPASLYCKIMKSVHLIHF